MTKEQQQKLLKSLVATIGQNKICDSLVGINKAFDIVRRETAEYVCDKFDTKMLKTKDENFDVASHRGGYNERVKENWEIKEQILKEIK